MPLGKVELATMYCLLRHNAGMRRESKIEIALIAGGLGAGSAPNGEREGQSPLAFNGLNKSREREGRSPLALVPWFQRTGARGAKPTRMINDLDKSREREGRSPLA